MCRAGRRKVTASERARRRAAGRSGSGRRRAGHGPGAAISAGQAPVRTADIAAVSRGLNSNKVVGMTGISANAARAPGRAGALGRVEGARGGHQAHTASGGGQRGLAACGAAHQQHRIARPGRRGRRTRGRPRAGPSTISSSLSGVTAERPLANPACLAPSPRRGPRRRRADRRSARYRAAGLINPLPERLRGLVRRHNRVSYEAAIPLARGTL